MRRIALVLALAAGMVGCTQPAAISHTVTGTITLAPGDVVQGEWTIGHECHATGGYSDIGVGTSVVLRDEHGTILASSALERGAWIQPDWRCSFSFTLTDVPDTAKFYAVTVSHRGEISESHDELAGADWVFALTLGG